jgi:hypothetical protein
MHKVHMFSTVCWYMLHRDAHIQHTSHQNHNELMGKMICIFPREGIVMRNKWHKLNMLCRMLGRVIGMGCMLSHWDSTDLNMKMCIHELSHYDSTHLICRMCTIQECLGSPHIEVDMLCSVHCTCSRIQD